MMETSAGHYVGYWTVPLGVKADGARLEVKVSDSFNNVGSQVAQGKLFINLNDVQRIK